MFDRTSLRKGFSLRWNTGLARLATEAPAGVLVQYAEEADRA